MVRFRSVFAVVSTVGFVTACSTFDTDYSSGPVVMGGTQTGVTVRYNPAETKAAEIDEIAIAFCKAYDEKPIRRGKSEYQPDVVYQAYDCVSPVASGDKTTFGNASPAAH